MARAGDSLPDLLETIAKPGRRLDERERAFALEQLARILARSRAVVAEVEAQQVSLRASLERLREHR